MEVFAGCLAVVGFLVLGTGPGGPDNIEELGRNCAAAVHSDCERLAEIAAASTGGNEGIEAVRSLGDDPLLARVARKGNDPAVRLAAVTKLKGRRPVWPLAHQALLAD